MGVLAAAEVAEQAFDFWDKQYVYGHAAGERMEYQESLGKSDWLERLDERAGIGIEIEIGIGIGDGD